MSTFQERPTAEAAGGQRSHWPVRKGRLSEFEGDEEDLSEITTVAARFAMMWQLAQDAWAFRGEPISEPQFSRHPGRKIRRGEELA